MHLENSDYPSNKEALIVSATNKKLVDINVL